MQMNVKNTLPRAGVDVEHSAPTFLLDTELLGEFLCNLNHVSDQYTIVWNDVVQGRDMLPGQYKNMDRRYRTDVIDCDDVVILVHQLRRNFALDDLAKQAWLHGCTLTHFARL